MKRIIQLLTIIAFSNVISYGANLPVIGGAVSQNNVNAGSGNNFFMVAVDDGDASLIQNISITGASSNTSLLQIVSIDYNSANTFATIYTSNTSDVTVVGVVTVTVSAMDADGTTSKSFAINIGDFYTKGASLKVYDMIFWQAIVPVKQNPKMEALISTTSLPTANEFYRPAKLTVGAGLACCGWFTQDQEYSYGFTNAITGYIKPSQTGTYSFANSSENGAAFYLNTIPGGGIYDKTGIVNTCSGTSCAISVYLEAGKYYGFHTANWIVYLKTYQLLWTGPGINTYQPIGYPNIYPLYDRVNPSAPTALSLVNKGVNFMTLQWKSATDNDKIAGYNLYRDGVKIASLNDSLYVATFLGANTKYSYAVSAFDRVGNESVISNILTSETYPTDNIPPTPPTQINYDEIGDMSAKISWSGASDIGSEVIGYYVYLNGNLYNQQYTTETNIVLKVLGAHSSNTVTIEAFDGAFNRSTKSAVSSFTTRDFDEGFISIGVRKAMVVIQPTSIARNPGLGMNFNYTDPNYYVGIWQQYMYDFQPGSIRWGGFSPNTSSFSATTGAGNPGVVTIGKFLKYCEVNNAHALFTCGVADNTDWMLNPETFTRFMEYVGDPTGQTPGGSRRVAEGYLNPFLNDTRPLIFEFGNEVWGGAVHFAPIGANYTNYGNWCRSMAAIMKRSPYYDSTKIKLAYSGRNPDPAESYGLHTALLANDHHEVDWLSLSGYMGGNLNYDSKVPQGETELQYFQSGTANMLQNLAGLKETMDADIIRSGRYRPTFFYEGNMTTPDYNGRIGQAVTMVDYYLSGMKLGGALPATFTLAGGEWSMTDASNGNSKLPFFNLSALINNNTKGNILKSDIKTLQVLDNGSGLKIGGDPVGVHVFNNGRKYAIAMFSREFDSDYQVQIILPKNGQYGNSNPNGTYTAEKYLFTSSDFSTRGSTTTLNTVTLKDSMIVTVPKYSAVLFVFDGPNLNAPLLPLGYTKYKKIDEIKIVNTSESKNIDIQYGSATFTVTAISMAVIDKRIAWDIQVPEGLEVSIDTTGEAKVFGSGTCEGNGVVTITAYSVEDPLVRDMVEVTISGQLTEGLETCEEPELITKSLNSKISIYPNPTEGVLNLRSTALQMSNVKIYNSSGFLVLDKTLGSQMIHQLQLGHLTSGLYLIKITTAQGIVSRKVRVN